MPRPITKSTSQKYTPKMKTVMITTSGRRLHFLRDGEVTFFISMRTSL